MTDSRSVFDAKYSAWDPSVGRLLSAMIVAPCAEEKVTVDATTKGTGSYSGTLLELLSDNSLKQRYTRITWKPSVQELDQASLRRVIFANQAFNVAIDVVWPAGQPVDETVMDLVRLSRGQIINQ